ncbi:hypothetical protein ACFU7Y_10615 [Kitasatospora sp. NPDC057542]|uniref:hypothetical protein n=1 Tax=Kitasatospora sp. NPDC057542 TaxID=3346162 RepID=UPI0036C62B65
MKLIVAGQDAVTPDEFAELALGVGIDAELFTGSEDETAEDRRVRLDAARDILRDLDGPTARFASALMRTAERRRVLTWKAAA